MVQHGVKRNVETSIAKTLDTGLTIVFYRFCAATVFPNRMLLKGHIDITLYMFYNVTLLLVGCPISCCYEETVQKSVPIRHAEERAKQWPDCFTTRDARESLYGRLS